MTAYDLARQRRRSSIQRFEHVALARPVPVGPTVALRPAAEVPFTPPAISVLKPVADTPLTLVRFVRDEFREAARKRDTAR